MPRHHWLGLSLLLVAASDSLGAQAMTPEWVARWRSDLVVVRDTVERIHPNAYHAVSRERFRASLDSLSAALPRLDHEAAVVALARTMAMVGDGHTRLTLPFDSAAGFFTGHSRTPAPRIPGLRFGALPVRLASLADGFFVAQVEEASRDLLGAQLVAIEGLTVEEVVRRITPIIHGDNSQQVADLLPSYLVLPALLRASGVGRSSAQATLQFEKDGKRIERTLRVPAADVTPRWAYAFEAARPAPPGAPNGSLTLYPGTRLAIARLRHVQEDGDGSIARMADSIERLFATGRATHLAVDLRGNPGGDAFLAVPLVRSIVRLDPLRRPGSVYALIDRGSFSAAVNLAADLEALTPAILVGEMTGGDPNTYGDSRRVVLPGTGLTIRISTILWQASAPDDRRRGIAPLLPILVRAEEWRSGRDIALERVVALARSRGSATGTWRGTAGARHQRVPLGLELQLGGSTPAGTLIVGRERRTLEEVRLDGDRFRGTWAAAEGRWRIEGYAAGDTLVAVAEYKGWWFPILMTRQ